MTRASQRFLTAIAAAGVAAGAGVSCGGSGPATLSEPVQSPSRLELVIADVSPGPGALATESAAARKATDLAIEEINDSIAKTKSEHTVEVIHAPASDARRAGAAAARAARSGARCLIGGWSVAETRAIAEAATLPLQLLQISPVTGARLPAGRGARGLVNRVSAPDSLQTPALASLIELGAISAEENGLTVIAARDPATIPLAVGLATEWERLGGAVAGGGPAFFVPGEPRSTRRARNLARQSRGSLALVERPHRLAALARELALGVRRRAERTFVASPGLLPQRLAPAERAALAGIRGVTTGGVAPGDAGAAFTELYGEDDATPAAPALFSATTFDATILCYLAAVAAGTTEADEMATGLAEVSGPEGIPFDWRDLPGAVDALERGQRIDYEGVSGPVDLGESGAPTAGSWTNFEITSPRRPRS